MADVEVISSHHERAVVRVGEVILKVNSDAAQAEVEVAAMTLAPVPVPEVMWQKPPVTALARLAGGQLARPGEDLGSSAEAWAAAGAMARTLHEAPLPPWPGWSLDEFAAHLDGACAWLFQHDVVPRADIERNRRAAEVALRPWTPVFTHGDLQAAHVFVDGDVVTGVIDWADACQGDPLFDLAVLTCGFGEHLDDVERGYRTTLDRDVIRGWWALRRLASVRWMTEHGFDPSGDIAVLRH